MKLLILLSLLASFTNPHHILEEAVRRVDAMHHGQNLKDYPRDIRMEYKKIMLKSEYTYWSAKFEAEHERSA